MLAEIANCLNTYFQSVFAKDKTVDQEIDKMNDKKVIGMDKISPIILKRCKTALFMTLLIIFHKSYSENIVSTVLKLANVNLNHKKFFTLR